MKIGLLIPTLARGGTERQVTQLALALRARGHAVTVVAFRGGGEFERELADAGVVLHVLQGGALGPASYLVNFARWTAAEVPDVIYSFLPPANILALIAGLVQRNCRIYWGIRSADMPLEGYGIKTKFAYWLERALCGAPDRIVANSHAGFAACLRKGYPKERLLLIANGFDTGLFHPDPAARMRLRAEFGIDAEEVLIGLPARLDPVKDHKTFLRAADILIRQHDNVRFICIGGGAAEVEKHLQGFAQDLGLKGKVMWTGIRGDMPDVLNALDIAALCSVSEGFPNTIGEAMACGVPCVVTDVGDAAFLVGESGVVLPPRDPAALAAAWSSLLSPEQRARLGHAARARMVELFSIERLADQTLAMFSGQA